MMFFEIWSIRAALDWFPSQRIRAFSMDCFSSSATDSFLGFRDSMIVFWVLLFAHAFWNSAGSIPASMVWVSVGVNVTSLSTRFSSSRIFPVQEWSFRNSWSFPKCDGFSNHCTFQVTLIFRYVAGTGVTKERLHHGSIPSWQWVQIQGWFLCASCEIP